jgi:hypothetical protein
MRRIIIILLSLCAVSQVYGEVKIFDFSGKVEVYKNNTWNPAQKDMALSQDNKIRTSDDGRAIVQFNENSMIWVKRNSELAVSSLGEDNLFSLILGKIRAKIKLATGNKFRVQTPVSVASIRGTEFVISSEGELSVMEGIVEFSDIKMIQNVQVGIGQMGQLDTQGQLQAPRDLTPEEQQKVSSEWQEFDGAHIKDQNSTEEKKETRVNDEKKQEDAQTEVRALKNELARNVADMKAEINVTRNMTDEIKQGDLSAGRTLRDVNGNLVRVEQNLLRPDSRTLQFLNLCKRSEYTYADRLGLGWGKRVPSGPRMDIMDVTMKMNMNLPEQLSSWPSFISDKGDALHPQSVVARFTNQADEIKSVGVWKLKGQLDEEGKPLQDDGMVFGQYINGWKVDTTYDAKQDPNAKFKEGSDASGNDSGQVWVYGISPQIKLVKDGNVEYVRLMNEGYGINNGGAIINVKDFTSSTDNPFTYVKQIAGEYITFCEKIDGNPFFAKGNLDLVIIPDVIVSTALQLASQSGDIMNNKSDNDDSGQNNSNNLINNNNNNQIVNTTH